MSAVKHQTMESNPSLRGVSPYSHQHSVLSLFFFLILTIQIGSYCYFIVVLICILITAHDVEHLCMCLLAICNSFSLKYLSMSFAHFLTILFELVFFSLFKVSKKTQETLAESNINNERMRDPFTTTSQF